MAAVQHTRTRSARLGGTSRALQTGGHSQQSQQSSNGSSSHGLAQAAAGVSGVGHGTGGSSPLSLFLTNLRLLDFDLLPDWPGVSADTFAATGTNLQGQKKRVQCVEWALFRLFELWDAEETASKLKPFFPPLDQLQSRNLRAALLRALEQTKKNGLLGRDAVIRKTMLDECKGDRLEEVLANFSTAVIKKLVVDDAAAEGEHPALAVELALEDRGYRGEKADLGSLVLAHRAALRRMLERKDDARAQYRDFADLLSIKERGLSRKNEVIRSQEKDTEETAISETARAEIRRTVQNNWSGNDGWMEALLYGDAAARGSGLLAMPFDRVWRRVQQDRLGELEEEAGGLLGQLESRVRVQNERLRKWEEFQQASFSPQAKPSPSKQKIPERRTRGIDLHFGAHQDMQTGRAGFRSALATTNEPRMSDEYTDLLQGLEHELAQLKKSDTNALNFLSRRSRQISPIKGPLQASDAEPEEPVSEMSELEDDAGDTFALKQSIQPAKPKPDSSRRQPVRPKLSQAGGSNYSAKSSSSSVVSKWTSRSERRETEITPVEYSRPVLEPRESGVSGSSKASSRSPTRNYEDMPPPDIPIHMQQQRYAQQQQRVMSPTQDVSPDLETSPTQDLADQILESMDGASPSPAKRPRPRHTLSLADRTRLSMVRTSSFLSDEEPELELPLGPSAANNQTPLSSNDDDKAALDEQSQDLASRTRKSMVGFEKAKQKAQLERRKSLRQSKVPPRREGSYFPKVVEEEGDVTKEELMTEEDMEAVFRSRPKVKASPVPSPARAWDKDDY